eukprot:12805391-Prorocentrum_lima.AAC.1
MTSSLVGSEMCIRDRLVVAATVVAAAAVRLAFADSTLAIAAGIVVVGTPSPLVDDEPAAQ